MPSTVILDHYRLPIINDKKMFRVLCEIYKAGPINEDEIAKKININNNDLKLIISKLYRANLINENRNYEWKTSIFSENFLTSLGISDITSWSIIDEINPNKNENAFLKACLYDSKNRNLSWSKNINNIIKASKFVFKFVSDEIEISHSNKLDILYALVIGTNPSAKNIDINTYCSKISDIYLNDNPNDTEVLFSKKNKLKEEYIDLCINAMSTFQNSNKYFLSDDIKSNIVISLVSFIRIVANLCAKYDTSELNIINHLDNNKFENRISSLISVYLDNTSPDKIEKLCFFLDINTNPKKRNKVKDQILYYLKQIVLNSKKILTSTVSCDNNYNLELYSDFIKPVKILKEKILSGSLDNLAIEDKDRIIHILESTKAVAINKFYGRSKSNIT